MSQPNTLLELIQVAPGGNTAFLLPEAGIRVSYDSLRKQVSAMADDLASIGIGRGDRVATVLPNGLPAVVSFLAGSVAGTAAPLNPGYREDEFTFFLEDTNAKVLLCMAEGAEAARKAAAALGVPVYTLEMDANGIVSIAGRASREDGYAADGRRHCASAAYQRKHGAAEAGADPASQHYGVDGEHCGHLQPDPQGRVAMRDAAVPCARAGGVDAFDLALRGHGSGAEQVQSAVFLADGERHGRYLVFGCSHHP